MKSPLIAGVAAVALLAGCAQNTAGSSPTLAAAQAEAQAIYAALQSGAALYAGASTTTPTEAAAVENVMTVAGTAVTAFANVQNGGSPTELAEQASTALEAVLSVLPIDPATKTAIDAGMAVIDGLVADLLAAPAALGATLASSGKEAPPVPIPPPHIFPPAAPSRA